MHPIYELNKRIAAYLFGCSDVVNYMNKYWEDLVHELCVLGYTVVEVNTPEKYLATLKYGDEILTQHESDYAHEDARYVVINDNISGILARKLHEEKQVDTAVS
jgi:hypothetical protein